MTKNKNNNNDKNNKIIIVIMIIIIIITIPFLMKMYWEKVPQDTATESLVHFNLFFSISLHF